jgi:acyl-CoA synthetase (AMP-forming)/AMP-acid ligase II
MNHTSQAQTIPAFLARISALYGSAVALTDGAHDLTYAELDRRSGVLAVALAAAGLGKASRVGLLIGNSPFFAVAFFAVARIGALPVLLSVLSAPAELAQLIKSADLQHMIVSPRVSKLDMLSKLDAALPGCLTGAAQLRLPDAPYLRQVWIEGEDVDERCALAMQDGQWPVVSKLAESCCAAGDLGVMIFTSGASGQAKGVVHTQGALIRQAATLADIRRMTEADRLFSLMPFFWVGGLAFDMMCCLHVGARVVCPDDRDPSAMLALMEQQKITRVLGWQSQIAPLMAHPDFSQRDLSSVIEGFYFDPAVYQALGMSETLGPHSGEPMGTVLADDMAGSFGRALGDTQYRIVDPATGAEQPAGESGELWLRSSSLMHGYYKLERHEWLTADGWLRTGDRAAIGKDRHLFFHGRLTTMLKSGGANVAPAEVEAAIVQHPSILDAVVFGFPDAIYGELVAAACLLRAGQTLDADELRVDLRGRLAGYKIPKHFVFLSAQPDFLTASGKVRHGVVEALARDHIARIVTE